MALSLLLFSAQFDIPYSILFGTNKHLSAKQGNDMPTTILNLLKKTTKKICVAKESRGNILYALLF